MTAAQIVMYVLFALVVLLLLRKVAGTMGWMLLIALVLVGLGVLSLESVRAGFVTAVVWLFDLVRAAFEAVFGK